MRILKGNTAQISFTDLIARISASGFSGRLTLNEGEHFCIVEFLNGNITGAFGWRLEGENALLHLLIENRIFNFSLPRELEINEKVDIEALPRGTKHVIELIETFLKDFGPLTGGLDKKIVINENVNTDVNLTSSEMLEVMKFTEPCPIDSLIDKNLKENLYRLKKFFDNNLLLIKD